jgi:hypothetical protein
METMSTKEAGLKDAREQLSLVLSFFPRVDARLSTILAINTGMLAALSASAPPLQNASWWMAITPRITTVLIVIGYVYLYRGGFPDVKGGQRSLIFFHQIASRTESGFIKEYSESSDEDLREDVLGQVWRNSEILKEKYRCVKGAFLCMALAILPWCASLAVFAICKANLRVLVTHQ